MLTIARSPAQATRSGIPSYRGNLYSPAVIADPYPVYAELRALGPVVWLTRHRVFALTRYDECKRALIDASTFVSGRGVALNPIANRLGRGTTLNSDGEDHAARRKLLAHRMMPRALGSLRDDVEAAARRVVLDAVARERVDGVDLARAVPLRVVPDLVGWPVDERDHLLRWAAATFDTLGPLNTTWVRSAASSVAMLRFAHRLAGKGNVLPDSMGAEIVAAAEAGTITRREAAALMIDYLGPALDTTISATASALRLFALHPDQWDQLRADRSLVPNAFNEVIRHETPLRAFSRVTTTDTVVAGAPLRRGSRVLVLFASANRDETSWDRPDAFDIHRDASRQLGFGHGTHGCAGQGLARLEGHTLLNALADHVSRFELVGKPTWARNNIIRGLASLPLHLHREPGRA